MLPSYKSQWQENSSDLENNISTVRRESHDLLSLAEYILISSKDMFK